MKRVICAGNWKMHKTAREAAEFADAFLPLARRLPEQVEIVLCPPFTALTALAPKLGGTRISLGAQDVHWEERGAFTGAISPQMLREHGVQYAIVGHSERREYFGDTDLTVRLKTATALAEGITPIVCVGETLELRDAGKALEHVTLQTRAALMGLSEADTARVVLAYEPVWAIGTGRNCDPGEANSVMAAMRDCVPGLHAVPVLYGGSVKAENIAAYTAQPDIDGGLVGGASLDPATFAALCANAA